MTVDSASLLPGWVGECAHPRLRCVTASFDNARSLDFPGFQRRVTEAYEAIFEQLDAGNSYCPVRFWAFVPGIHDDLGAGLDRYMAFNAGRYAAFTARFGRPASFDVSVPTGSAVGTGGDTFSLYCAAADEPGSPVENPRQVSAYHYSRRFGPKPPCFARATLLRGEGESLLLVGGTASITGEDSRHLGALDAQVYETFSNLASVVASATGRCLPENASARETEALLHTFRELRVYYTSLANKDALLALIRATFPSRCRVEWIQALLCRRELLVEIEGVASLHTSS